MKKYLLFLAVMTIGNGIYCYCQSSDYTKYYNQTMQRMKDLQNQANSLERDAQRYSNEAARSTAQYIYEVYYDGQKIGKFPDKASCDRYINSAKGQMNGYFADLLKQVPAEFRSQLSKSINESANKAINNFSSRRISNPNYRPANQINNTLIGSNKLNTGESGYPSSTKEKDNAPATSTSEINDAPKNNAIQSLIVSSGTDNNPKSVEDALIVSTAQKPDYGSTPVIDGTHTVDPSTRGVSLAPVSNLSSPEKEITKTSEEIDELKKQKDALHKEFMDMLDLCKNAKSDFACQDLTKPITDSIASIDGRIEWLGKVEKMTPETLKAQEKNWGKIAEMAGLSEYSYKEKEGLPSDSRWKPAKDSIFANIIAKKNNNNSGFHCELLYNEQTKQYVLSFRGTEVNSGMKEAIKDVGSDAVGSITNLDFQTQAANGVVKELLDQGIDPKNIQLTGHSLGGRLAAEAAIKYNLTAYTFNAADISHQTKTKAGINNKANIINIVSANDNVVTQNGIGLGSSKGGVNAGNARSYYIGTSSNYMTGYTNVIKEAYTGHGIAALREVLEQRHKDIQQAILEK